MADSCVPPCGTPDNHDSFAIRDKRFVIVEITNQQSPSQMTKFPGGNRGRVTPVPIPNTEVKPATADGTACAGVWESRSLPGINS